ncbi:MAG: TlpA disulfide reductase family protein [Pseudomonadota bacterium]
MKSFLTLLAVGLVALVLGAVMGRVWRDAPPVPELNLGNGVAVGDPMPNFRHAALDGQFVSRDDLIGQPALINFWATWCAPCVREMPMLQAYAAQHADRLQMVGIAIDEPGQVHGFVQELGVTYRILVGTSDVMQTQRDFGNANGMLPFTVLVDAQGIVRWQHLGEVKPEHLAEFVTPLL